jgi:hypothetical protein
MGTDGPTVKESSLGSLLDSDTLPSGHRFALKPDTVEVALSVAEATGATKYHEKLAQVSRVIESVDGKNVAESGGVDFLQGMLDTDIVFISLAWTLQNNGRSLAMKDGVQCPKCATKITSIDLSEIRIFAADVAGADAIKPSSLRKVEVDPELLPPVLKSGGVYVGTPTWYTARRDVPDASWTNQEVVKIHRVLSVLHAKSTDGQSMRALARAEARGLRTAVVKAAALVLDDHVPYIVPSLIIICSACKDRFEVPFDQPV